MQKLFLTLISLCLFTSIKAKDSTSSNYLMKYGELVISEVVPVDHKSKDALFQDAIIWINNNFNSPKTVIQTKDSDLGLITLKSIAIQSEDYEGRPSQWFTFSLSIQVKDGRYKYEFSNLEWNWDLSDIGKFVKRKPSSAGDKDVHKVFCHIIFSRKKQMTKQEDEW